MRNTAVPTNVPLSADRRLHRLRLRLRGGLRARSIPEDNRQRVVEVGGDRLLEIDAGRRLRRAAVRAMDPDEARSIALLVERWRSGLFAGDLLALVRQAVLGADSPWDRARRLSRFVNRVLVSKRSFQLLASAEDALRFGEGDCTEHAALLSRFLDLARIRSRVVLGLVYSDRAFRLHQWVEVKLPRADDWLPLDPMSADDDIDATYVKLTSFRPEGAYFEGPAILLDSLSSTRAELIAADFGSGWQSLTRRR